MSCEDIEEEPVPGLIAISERARRVQQLVDHYGIVLPFNLAMAVQIEIDGAVAEALMKRASTGRCEVDGCRRYATLVYVTLLPAGDRAEWLALGGCHHGLCKMHENGPCARCRQLAGEEIPLVSTCFPVNP